MSDAPTPSAFYTEFVPGEWNRALAEQERAAEEARRVLEGMRAVTATLRVEVEGEAPVFLNISEGRMQAGEAAAQEPFLTVIQDRTAFERLAAEAGGSALALLGGLTGMAGEIRLTQSKLDLLAAVTGLLRFEVTGESGFSLLTLFGDGPAPAEPTTTIRVDEAGYRELRAGRLDPQAAFLQGRIQVEGDPQLAMQLALAALSPD